MERFWRSYKWECVYLKERMKLKELKEITMDCLGIPIIIAINF